MIKNRIKQYFNMILVAIILGTTLYPISANATTYYMDGEGSSDTTISEGMILNPYDSIHISSNLHSHIYSYPYNYSGAYGGESGYSEENWAMSGQMMTVDNPNTPNCVWEVKKINGHDIYLQEVKVIDVEELADQSVLTGQKATFSVEVTKNTNTDLYYRWYKVVGQIDNDINNENDDIYINNSSDTLDIESNNELYQNGTKFYCVIYNYYSINYVTNAATLSISNGYSLTYKSMDGSTTYKTDSNKYTNGKQVTLDFENIPTEANQKFIGWSTTPNSKIANYKKATDKLTMPNANTVLYAVFTENKLTINPVTLEGTFSYGSSLKVETLKENNTDETLVKLLDKSKNLIGSYNISIENGEYEGKINLTFDVGEKYNGKELTVYHKLASGKVETRKATVKDGKLSIIVDELSPFMVTENKVVTNPNTIDDINIYMIGGIVSLIGIGLLLNKKTRLN